MILPGSTIGILGGGQLGRMLAQAAQALGYRVHIYEPQKNCPAGSVAHLEVNAAYTDLDQLRAFARGCDVVTYEFENIPVGPLAEIETLTKLRPSWSVLEICQNRLREKHWLRRNGIPHANFAEVEIGGDLAAAIRTVGLPCVVKTADFGYDGKGQIKVAVEADIARATESFAEQRAVVEQFINFKCELSVVVARSTRGEVKTFPVAENIHTHHILDFSILPARVDESICQRAEALGKEIAERLDAVGLIAVEFFLTHDDQLVVNEMAPRPHNSGHYTMDACVTSQFEQHVRAVCDLPLGDTRLRNPVVMLNILGDAWYEDNQVTVKTPTWDVYLANPGVKLHLYGKAEPRLARKMGHFNVMADSVDEALEQARLLKSRL